MMNFGQPFFDTIMTHSGKTALLTTLLLLSLVSSCSRIAENNSNSKNHTQKLIDIYGVSRWYSLLSKGMYDSVAFLTEKYFSRSSSLNDSTGMLYSGLILSQSLIMLEELDSAKLYIDIISKPASKSEDPQIGIAYNTLMGTYLLKTDLDYSDAMNFYLKGLEYAVESKDTINAVSLLSNIVNIYYIRSDAKGLLYADEAYNLAKDKGDLYFLCMARLQQSQMYYLNGQTDKSDSCASEAEDLAKTYTFNSLLSSILLQKADNATKRRNDTLADKLYKETLEYIRYSEPATATIAYYNYGRYLENNGLLSDAIRKYQKGLEISEANGNVEYREKLTKKLLNAALTTGDRDNIAYYSKKYLSFIDSLSVFSKEQEFNRLMSERQELEHELELSNKEIELLQTRKAALTAVFIIIIVIAISLMLLLMWRKERRTSRLLFDQHQQYLRRYEAEKNKAERNNNATFSVIENLMNGRQIWRQKDLSLESIADAAGTNRTYVSSAINTCTGMTVSAYINSYRIKEAIRLMSSRGKAALVKSIADECGFNSTTSFARAFQKETGCSPTAYMSGLKSLDSRQHNS